MSDDPTKDPGAIAWVDLTVADATGIRDFYRAVVGWTSSDVQMGAAPTSA